MFEKLKGLFRKKKVIVIKAKKPLDAVEPKHINNIEFAKAKRMVKRPVLDSKQVEFIHNYYFNISYEDRLKNINHLKFKPKSGRQTYIREKIIDGSVHDYIIGWASTDKICKRWLINSGELYTNIRFINDLVENYAVSE